MQPARIVSCLVLGAAPLSAQDLTADPVPRLRVVDYDIRAGDGPPIAAQRGHVFVPENRRNPNTATIQVAYIRVPSTAERATTMTVLPSFDW